MKKIFKTLRTFATRNLTFTFDKVDFAYTHLSWKRMWNWFLAELSYSLKSDRAWAFPTHLQIEPANLCNLRCPVCHIVTDNKPQGLLSLENFEKLIDEVGDYLLFLHLWGWGEPFINQDFFSMIRYAKNKGIKMISSTNGHFFEDKKNIDRLIDSRLDVLIFALDGVTQETYEKYRHQGDFDKALRGLRLLLERRKERKALSPLLNLRMLVTRDNEDEVPQMKKLAQQIGVDMLTLKTMNTFDNEAEGHCLLPLQSEYLRFEYDDSGQPIKKKNLCKKLWNHPTVYRDGVVVPCDYYTGQELPLGHVFNGHGSGFREVWFGERFRQLRSRFIKGERSGLRCENCALNFANVDRCVSHAFTFNEITQGRSSGWWRG
jgi:MoaA/NifB/PqqE/SkfB family radical SAM enzyme